MIVFDGVSIDSVAPVMIEDIKVSPIRYNPVVRPRAIRFGSEFVRMGGGERTVVVTFAILEKNKVLRQEYFRNLSVWAKTDAEYMLEVPQDPLRYLQCVCTDKPEPSTRAWWENKLRLTFTCYTNPYWTSKLEKTVPCGTTFFALGDAPPLMRIEYQEASGISGRSYSNGIQTMTFSPVPVGKLVIDLNKQTAVVNDVSIMQYYQPSGSFIIPKVGTQSISGYGAIKYRERWE
jgi:phage-related protein